MTQFAMHRTLSGERLVFPTNHNIAKAEEDQAKKLAYDADALKQAHAKMQQRVSVIGKRYLDTSIVERARENYRSRPSAISPDFGRWDQFLGSLRDTIEKVKTPLDVLQAAQRDIPFDHRADNTIELITLFRSMLETEFPLRRADIAKFSDDPFSLPSSTWLTAAGTLESNMFYWHLRTLFSCLEHAEVPFNPSIVEIGGGYGALARLWMGCPGHMIKRYTLIDVPECLFFAEVYLTTVFGPDFPFVFMPIGTEEKYDGDADLVINTGSLQEMSGGWVDHWMAFLDKTKAKYFYSLNYMGQSIAALHESRNNWAPVPSREWEAMMINSSPPLVQALSPGRHFAEVLYERKACTAAPTPKRWSVLDGAKLTRQTYLEGLELVRQWPYLENMLAFVEIVLRSGFVPKELLVLAASLPADEPRAIKIKNEIQRIQKDSGLLMCA